MAKHRKDEQPVETDSNAFRVGHHRTDRFHRQPAERADELVDRLREENGRPPLFRKR